MTTTDPKIDLNGTATVAEIAQAAAIQPTEHQPGEVLLVPKREGGVEILDTDAYAEHPRRAKAIRQVNDAESFNLYLAEHGTADSEVWADTKNSAVVAIIDAHADEPGWEDHRLRLVLEKTPAWIAWAEMDGKMVGQVDFAEFIDLRASDVREPEPAALIELAQFFEAKRNLEYESSERMTDGQTRLVYKETISAKAGQKGDIQIPDRIQLVLKPYIGGPSYYVWARFRYRIHGSALLLGYVIERPQEILDAAFADIVALIQNGKSETPDQQATDSAPFRPGSKGFAGVTQRVYFGRPRGSE